MSAYTFSPENIARIGKLAFNLRNKHDAMGWGVLPTELMRLEGLDYHEYDLQDKSLLNRITKGAREVAKKIMAALCVREKAVLIDDTLHPAKKPFGQSHELGHYCIPEHKQVFYFCSEHDLVPSMRSEMEFEANTFASELLFPDHLMKSIFEEYPLSMQTIFFMQSNSGASMHSAAIKYVTANPDCCCFVSLMKMKDEDGILKSFKIKSIITSHSWWNKYNRLIDKDQEVPLNHNLVRIVSEGGGQEGFQKTSIKVGETKLEFDAHTFYNSYEVFALIFKEAE